MLYLYFLFFSCLHFTHFHSLNSEMPGGQPVPNVLSKYLIRQCTVNLNQIFPYSNVSPPAIPLSVSPYSHLHCHPIPISYVTQPQLLHLLFFLDILSKHEILHCKHLRFLIMHFVFRVRDFSYIVSTVGGGRGMNIC